MTDILKASDQIKGQQDKKFTKEAKYIQFLIKDAV